MMKSIFKSKAFWLNLLVGIAAVSGYLPANPYTMAAGAVANIILRMITNQPVSIPVINPNPTVPPVSAPATVNPNQPKEMLK